jgi:hypothetical protein
MATPPQEKTVTPVRTGIQKNVAKAWIPACAGMTVLLEAIQFQQTTLWCPQISPLP